MAKKTANKETKIGFQPADIAQVFGIKKQKECVYLVDWMTARYELNALETQLFEKIYEDSAENADYWNEEELKIRLVGTLFLIADIEQKNKIKVFYERPLTATVNGHDLNVKADCFVGTSSEFNSPLQPYFFLQEFKKLRGEKNDPEGQMMTAMLISQALNQDNKPIYGGFLFGSNWWFTTLIGQNYCTSKKFDTSKKEELLQIVFILRKLKDLILNR
ncbi:MAG: hypothetical protein RLZZ292_2330 [Bacteroidota bacterium]|jgi:hypothetical protein